MATSEGINWDDYEFEPSCTAKGHGDTEGVFADMHDDGPAVYAIMSSCPNCNRIVEQLACKLVASLFIIDLQFNAFELYMCNECEFVCTLWDRNFEIVGLNGS